MDAEQCARLLEKIAAMLEIQGKRWEPVAYRRAAASLREVSEPIEEIAKKRKLEEIPGIGQGIAKKLYEFIETGKLNYVDQLKKELPMNVEELMAIPGLGPKKIKLFFEVLKIKDKASLKRALVLRNIRSLPGFGEKSEARLLRGIQDTKGKRYPLEEILPLASKFEQDVRKLPYVRKVIVAGSIRRREKTVGDIDVLVDSGDPKRVMQYFTKYPLVRKVLTAGAKKSSVIWKNGIQVDIRVVPDESFGAALQYFTGNKAHNVRLRMLAIKKGLKLNEYGLFKGKKRIAGESEDGIYKALGLKCPPPEKRLA
ncbi:hypothetical protein J4464_03170 [Candidatus Woesearchaeota archaeon]|nr:hypothetical protein [Candidatus Woesearchaeota archaeon]